jgi:hypothetical protein
MVNSMKSAVAANLLVSAVSEWRNRTREAGLEPQMRPPPLDIMTTICLTIL